MIISELGMKKGAYSNMGGTQVTQILDLRSYKSARRDAFYKWPNKQSDSICTKLFL